MYIGSQAWGKNSTSAPNPSNTTLTTSKNTSASPSQCSLRYFWAAEAILFCFSAVTFSSGAADTGAVRLFTSTKCRPFASLEIMSISRCPPLQFRCSILGETHMPSPLRELPAHSFSLRS